MPRACPVDSDVLCYVPGRCSEEREDARGKPGKPVASVDGARDVRSNERNSPRGEPVAFLWVDAHRRLTFRDRTRLARFF